MGIHGKRAETKQEETRYEVQPQKLHDRELGERIQKAKNRSQQMTFLRSHQFSAAIGGEVTKTDSECQYVWVLLLRAQTVRQTVNHTVDL